MKNHDSIDIIHKLIKNKTENLNTDDELLIHYYTHAKPDEQKIIDTIMVCVCGYSLETIINHPENIKGLES
jgi:hypothetical protein